MTPAQLNSETPNSEAELSPPVPRVSAVIVTHNRKESLLRLLQQLGDRHQVVVVDNGSTDGTSAELQLDFPKVRLSRLPKNFGLTKALNIGIRASDGNYVLLLHDDVVLTADQVDQLADYLEQHPECGAVSPLLTNKSGAPLPQGRSLPTPAEPDPAYTVVTGQAAECVLGAATMYRTFFLRAIRQIDERYGTYGPDVELGWQVKKAGKTSVVLQDVKAVHLALPSTVNKGKLAGDRIAGTANYLGTHVGLGPALLYRFTQGLAAVLTFRFPVIAGAFTGQKIDGTS